MNFCNEKSMIGLSGTKIRLGRTRIVYQAQEITSGKVSNIDRHFIGVE